MCIHFFNIPGLIIFILFTFFWHSNDKEILSFFIQDEPTSGLDAHAASIVMRAVRSVADSQRCCLVTIHQPSMDIFESFDSLVLLQRGGKLTYFGPLGRESCELISYLEVRCFCDL